jgi:hypothetical protein
VVLEIAFQNGGAWLPPTRLLMSAQGVMTIVLQRSAFTFAESDTDYFLGSGTFIYKMKLRGEMIRRLAAPKIRWRLPAGSFCQHGDIKLSS